MGHLLLARRRWSLFREWEKKKGGEGEEGEKNLSNRERNRETVEKHGDDGISSVPDHELMGSRSLNSY